VHRCRRSELLDGVYRPSCATPTPLGHRSLVCFCIPSCALSPLRSTRPSSPLRDGVPPTANALRDEALCSDAPLHVLIPIQLVAPAQRELPCLFLHHRFLRPCILLSHPTHCHP
jgi:hypothetical protein